MKNETYSLTHVAIIMDGNGRWAEKNGLPRFKGHEKGAENVEMSIKGCLNLGIRFLTLYAFSLENWQRPKREVAFLMAYLSRFIDDKLPVMHKERIRFNVIGDISYMSSDLQKKIADTMNETHTYDRLTLTLALSYGSRQEIVRAAQLFAQDVQNNKFDPDALNEALFSSYLYTNTIPDPDLIIRTSGELRISNFLLWQMSYAELLFLEKYWPEFTEDDLRNAAAEYDARKRRFGKV